MLGSAEDAEKGNRLVQPPQPEKTPRQSLIQTLASVHDQPFLDFAGRRHGQKEQRQGQRREQQPGKREAVHGLHGDQRRNPQAEHGGQRIGDATPRPRQKNHQSKPQQSEQGRNRSQNPRNKIVQRVRTKPVRKAEQKDGDALHDQRRQNKMDPLIDFRRKQYGTGERAAPDKFRIAQGTTPSDLQHEEKILESESQKDEHEHLEPADARKIAEQSDLRRILTNLQQIPEPCIMQGREPVPAGRTGKPQRDGQRLDTDGKGKRQKGLLAYGSRVGPGQGAGCLLHHDTIHFLHRAL